MAAFKAGEIDFIASFSPEHVDTMRAQNRRARIMTGKEANPWLSLFPGLAIFVTVLGFNLFSDGLRDALNPRLSRLRRRIGRRSPH